MCRTCSGNCSTTLFSEVSCGRYRCCICQLKDLLLCHYYIHSHIISADLILRGKNIQKKMKKSGNGKGKHRVVKDGSVILSICSMKITTRGSYTRDSPNYEVSVNICDPYSTIIEKATAVLDIPPTDDLVLIRQSGSIVTQELSSNKPWTLGNYLNHLHIAAEKLTLGLGYRKRTSMVSKVEYTCILCSNFGQTNQVSCPIFQLKVCECMVHLIVEL